MILVTGAAGFIGFHLSQRLLRDGAIVHGIDNLNAYYDVGLKEARLGLLAAHPDFAFHRADLADGAAMAAVFEACKPETVVHLAAQAGVRHSLSDPRSYVDSNLIGFLNILEGCRRHGVKHLVYASSSSVYGLNTSLPLSVHQCVDHPVSFYAATKKANELMAHSYSHLFGLPTTGLRFFTVYGPWGRPDMALFSFTKAILAGRAIDIFGDGRMRRDYTYADDAVEAIVRVMRTPPSSDRAWSGTAPDPASSSAPYRLLNIGNGSAVEVLRLIEVLEACLARKAERRFVAALACEVPATIADTAELKRLTGFAPGTDLEAGVRRFADWYRAYYRQ